MCELLQKTFIQIPDQGLAALQRLVDFVINCGPI